MRSSHAGKVDPFLQKVHQKSIKLKGFGTKTHIDVRVSKRVSRKADQLILTQNPIVIAYCLRAP